MGLNNYSSGYSSDITAPWSLDTWSNFQTSASEMSGRHLSSSIEDDAVEIPRYIDAVIEEFRMNGTDSRYDPDEDSESNNKYTGALIGMGPSALYLRQKSWPVPEASPTASLSALGLADDYTRPSGQGIVSAETASAELIEMGPSALYLRQKSWPVPEASPTAPLSALGLADDYTRPSVQGILSAETAAAELIEMGPSALYLRQKSWPVPEASPTAPLPALGLADDYTRPSGQGILSAETAAAALIGMGPSALYLRQKSWPVPEASPTAPPSALGLADYTRPSGQGIVSAETAAAELIEMGPSALYLRQKSWPVPEASPTAPPSALGLADYTMPSGQGIVSAETAAAALIGMGPSALYLRQKSWPVPEASPTAPLPALGLADDYTRPSGQGIVSAETASAAFTEPPPLISTHQLEVLNSLPNSVLYFLLRKLEKSRGWENNERPTVFVECRFCKNNGELEAQYRSHLLRWQGRIVCPILRAYRCRRCGAEGDDAHTLKYCPLTTDRERRDLAARMRSVHSRRRRFQKTTTDVGGVDLFYSNTNIPTDGAIYHQEPLDPIWEALANKLML